MRSVAVWKGSLSFGLVNINIELYTAIKEHVFGFKLLHAKCKMPITYERWCSKCKEEVDWANIVKGFKLEDGSYFILTKENLEKLKPERTDEISIVEFIDARSLEPIYFDQHYYIAPSRANDKAFFLFARVLEKLDKIAIGQFVMRDKEYVCAIQPYKNALLLSTLNYEYEVKHVDKIEELETPKELLAELKLAEQLVNKLSVKKFDMSRFKDSFAEHLIQKIKQASKGIYVPKVAKAKKIKEKESSLIEALQGSLKSKKTVHPQVYSQAKSSSKSKVKAKAKRTRTLRAKRRYKKKGGVYPSHSFYGFL